MKEKNPMLDVALEYAHQGWSVFPLDVDEPLLLPAHFGRDPLRDNCHGQCGLEGHGHWDATTEPETIVRWWTQSPEANVGLQTGLKFDVLEVRRDVGHDSLFLQNWPDSHEPMDFCGPWAYGEDFAGETVYQFYFEPIGLRSKAGFIPSCNWLGLGGYVVAPTSFVDEGTIYFWYFDATFPETPLANVPEWLIELISLPAHEFTQ